MLKQRNLTPCKIVIILLRASRTFKWVALGCGTLGGTLLVTQLVRGTVHRIRRRRMQCASSPILKTDNADVQPN